MPRKQPPPIQRRPVRKAFTQPSKAKQSFKAECDINNIMKKYEKYGVLEHVNNRQGVYADVSHATDYQTSLNAVMAAQGAFMELPATIRKQFDNDPGQFIEFVENPDNQQALIDMGLATRIPRSMPEETPQSAPAETSEET